MIKINILSLLATLALCWVVQFMSSAMGGGYVETLAVLALFLAVRNDLSDIANEAPK